MGMGFELRFHELPPGIDIGEAPDLTAPPTEPRAEAMLLQEGVRLGGPLGPVIDRAGVEYAAASFRGAPWIERVETRDIGGKLALFGTLRPGVYPAGDTVVTLALKVQRYTE